MGDGSVHRGHAGERCGGAPAGNRDAWSSCQSSLAAGCTLPVRAEGCHHEKLPKHIHARHCPDAQRMPLDPLRAVGAVQVGAAVGAEVVACLYVDHLASAHGALLFLASSHPPCSGIRSILLMPAGTVPAAAATLLVCAPAPELPHAGIASQMRPARSRPPEPHEPGLDAYRSLTGRARGSSGCMGQDGVPGRQGSRPPMPFPLSLRSRRLCLPVQPVCMVAVPWLCVRRLFSRTGLLPAHL